MVWDRTIPTITAAETWHQAMPLMSASRSVILTSSSPYLVTGPIEEWLEQWWKEAIDLVEPEDPDDTNKRAKNRNRSGRQRAREARERRAKIVMLESEVR